MGLFFGIAAAVCWGVGDFLITLLTRKLGTRFALLSIQVLSLAAWLLIFLGRAHVPAAKPLLWAIMAATGVCHVLGLAFVYRAFEVGTLAIVSPISAGFAVVTALLSIASGERLPAVALGGTALLVAGVALATRSSMDPSTRQSAWRGVPEAIASAVAFGTMFWLFYFYVQPAMGYVAPLVVLKMMAVGGSALAAARGWKSSGAALPTFGIEAILLGVGAAAADTAAWLAYIAGTGSTYATIVTALASLFSAVTVLLAAQFLRERLAWHQWAGVAVILVGILLVSV